MTGAQACSVEVCDRPAQAHGMCLQHRWRAQNGRPIDTPIGEPVRPDHCRKGHPWTDENTYKETRDGRTYRRCRECRKEALGRHRAKTRAESQTSVRAYRTHCAKGHEYAVGGTGKKYCRECRAEYQRERRATARAARPPAEPRATKTGTPKPKQPKSKLPKGWDRPADRNPKRERQETVDKGTQWVDPGPPLPADILTAARALLARHDALDLAGMLGLDEVAA